MAADLVATPTPTVLVNAPEGSNPSTKVAADHQRSCSTGSIASRSSGKGIAYNELPVLVDRLLVNLVRHRSLLRNSSLKKHASAAEMSSSSAFLQVPADSKDLVEAQARSPFPEPLRRGIQKRTSMPILPLRRSSLIKKIVHVGGLPEQKKSAFLLPRKAPPVPDAADLMEDVSTTIPAASTTGTPAASWVIDLLEESIILGDGSAFSLVTPTAASSAPQRPIPSAEDINQTTRSKPFRQRRPAMTAARSRASPTPMIAEEPLSPLTNERHQLTDSCSTETLRPSMNRSPGSQQTSSCKSSSASTSTSQLSQPSTSQTSPSSSLNEISVRATQVATMGTMPECDARDAMSTACGIRFPSCPSELPTIRAAHRRSVILNDAKLSDALGNDMIPNVPEADLEVSRFSWTTTTNSYLPEKASSSASDLRRGSASTQGQPESASAGETNKKVTALGTVLFGKQASKQFDFVQQERGPSATRINFLHRRSRSVSERRSFIHKSVSVPSLKKAAIKDDVPSSPSTPLSAFFRSGNQSQDAPRSRSATPSASRLETAGTRSATPESPSLRTRFSVNFSTLSGSRRTKLSPAIAIASEEELEVLEAQRPKFVSRGSWISDSDDPRAASQSPIQRWQEEIIRKGPQRHSSLLGKGRWERVRVASLSFIGVLGNGNVNGRHWQKNVV